MDHETRIEPAHLRHTTREDGGTERPGADGFYRVVREEYPVNQLSLTARNVIARSILGELEKVCGRARR